MSMSNTRSKADEAPRQKPDGILRVTTGTLKLPEGLETDQKARDDGMNRLVLVIVAGALILIAVIAWLISMGQ